MTITLKDPLAWRIAAHALAAAHEAEAHAVRGNLALARVRAHDAEFLTGVLRGRIEHKGAFQ